MCWICPESGNDCGKIPYEPGHDKIYKMACAHSKDSDQPGHPPTLIRVFTVRMKKACVLSYPLSRQRRLIRLGRCPGWSVFAGCTCHFVGFVMCWLLFIWMPSLPEAVSENWPDCSDAGWGVTAVYYFEWRYIRNKLTNRYSKIKSGRLWEN